MLKLGRFIEFQLGQKKCAFRAIRLDAVGCSNAFAVLVQLGSLSKPKAA